MHLGVVKKLFAWIGFDANENEEKKKKRRKWDPYFLKQITPSVCSLGFCPPIS